MDKFKGTQGKWKVGIPGTVVSDNGDNMPKNTGHSDVEYYGGYLIAESIASNHDAQLIAAAPDLLEVAIFTYNDLLKKGVNVDNVDIFKRVQKAIEKALGS